MRCENCGREGLEEVITDEKARLFCGEECKAAIDAKNEVVRADNHKVMVVGDHAKALEIVDKYRILGEENQNHLKMHLDMLWKKINDLKQELADLRKEDS